MSYTVRPEAYAEHVRLIERVFAQLREECPGNVDYQVLCLADGVSFVHVSNHETADGSSPLPALSTFKEFTSGLAHRVATPPTASDAKAIGTYRGRTDTPPKPKTTSETAVD